MKVRSGLRGQPLAVLLAIVGGWTGLRAMTWEAPDWHREQPAAEMPALLAASPLPETVSGQIWADGGLPYSVAYSYPTSAYPGVAVWQEPPLSRMGLPSGYSAVAAPLRIVVNELRGRDSGARPVNVGGEAPMLAAGHQQIGRAHV